MDGNFPKGHKTLSNQSLRLCLNHKTSLDTFFISMHLCNAFKIKLYFFFKITLSLNTFLFLVCPLDRTLNGAMCQGYQPPWHAKDFEEDSKETSKLLNLLLPNGHRHYRAGIFPILRKTQNIKSVNQYVFNCFQHILLFTRLK